MVVAIATFSRAVALRPRIAMYGREAFPGWRRIGRSRVRIRGVRSRGHGDELESLALAGLMLIARFAAATVWRSEFGPLPLERPG